MNKSPKTIILDFGGVLGLPHDPAREITMASLCHLPLGEFLSAYQRDRRELDMGTLPTPEYWKRMLSVAGAAPTPKLLARLEQEDTLAWTRINHTVVQWAAELRAAGYVTAILSNMPRETVAYMRSHKDFRWLRDFAVSMFSCEEGAAKPDLPIYRQCIAKLGTVPASCLFLDDSPVNVAGARAAGIPAQVFSPSPAAALALARTWALPVENLLPGLSRAGR
jgi:putative hydrolase of the HAD superfamily